MKAASEWAWQFTHADEGLSVLAMAVAVAVQHLVPAESPNGRQTPWLELVVLQLVAALSVARLRRARQKARCPRWAASAFRLPPPNFATEVMIPTSATLAWMRELLVGQHADALEMTTVVYLLFAHTTTYLGIANLMRQDSPVTPHGVAERLREHLVGAMKPCSKDGGKPRYRGLRMALATLCFLPVMALPSRDDAFRMESLGIRLENPVGNAVDLVELRRQQHGNPECSRLRKPRLRPPSWRRRKDRRMNPTRSIWALPVATRVRLNAPVVRTEHPLLPGTMGMTLPFGELYRAQQAELWVSNRFVGPLWVWSPLHGALFLMYLCSRKPSVWIPRIGLNKIARHLYWLNGVLESLLPIGAQRASAARRLDRILRRLALPPLRVPIFLVPACFRGTPAMLTLKKTLYGLVARYPCRPARHWLRAHLRVAFAKRERWDGAVDVARRCASAAPEIRAMHQQQGELHDLQAIQAPWKLPVWPTERAVARQVQRAWRDWAARAAIPKGTRMQGGLAWAQCLREVPVPPPPATWTELQEPLERAVANLGGKTLVHDDRDKGKCWSVPLGSLASHLEAALEADTAAWRR